VAIARVVEQSNEGPIMQDILKNTILPIAFQFGNRWLGSWAFWLLHRRDLAVRIILVRESPYLFQFQCNPSILPFIDTFTRHCCRLQHANFGDWRASLRRPELSTVVLTITIENVTSCERNQRNFRSSRIQFCLTNVSCVL
jgi:hypothetical protein